MAGVEYHKIVGEINSFFPELAREIESDKEVKRGKELCETLRTKITELSAAILPNLKTIVTMTCLEQLSLIKINILSLQNLTQQKINQVALEKAKVSYVPGVAYYFNNGTDGQCKLRADLASLAHLIDELTCKIDTATRSAFATINRKTSSSIDLSRSSFSLSHSSDPLSGQSSSPPPPQLPFGLFNRPCSKNRNEPPEARHEREEQSRLATEQKRRLSFGGLTKCSNPRSDLLNKINDLKGVIQKCQGDMRLNAEYKDSLIAQAKQKNLEIELTEKTAEKINAELEYNEHWVTKWNHSLASSLDFNKQFENIKLTTDEARGILGSLLQAKDEIKSIVKDKLDDSLNIILDDSVSFFKKLPSEQRQLYLEREALYTELFSDPKGLAIKGLTLLIKQRNEGQSPEPLHEKIPYTPKSTRVNLEGDESSKSKPTKCFRSLNEELLVKIAERNLAKQGIQADSSRHSEKKIGRETMDSPTKHLHSIQMANGFVSNGDNSGEDWDD